MDVQEQSKKEFFKEWLEKLQQESWQLELLISGFAILGLVQSKPLLFSFVESLKEAVSVATVPLMIISLAIIFGWYIFVTNLIIHILVRGLWIGAIGLRYVSGDIDYDKLRYNDLFSNYFKKKVGSFDNYIEKLEKLASVLFAYTFLLLFMVISVLFFFSIFISGLIFIVYIINGFELPSNNVNIENPAINIMILVFFISGLMVLIDFIGLGFLKRIKQKHFAKFYYSIFRLFSILTLSHLWRPLLLNFLDTKYTKRLFLLAIPYGFVLAFVLPSLEILQDEYYPTFQEGNHRFSSIINEHTYHYQYYDDERKRMIDAGEYSNINFISLPSKRISGNYLELFIKAHENDGLIIKNSSNKNFPLSKKGIINSRFSSRQFGNEDIKRDSTIRQETKLNQQSFSQNIVEIKDILSNAIRIEIDDIEVSNELISYDFYLHQDNHDKGLLAYIPIDHLSSGRHLIYMSKKIGWNSDKNGISIDSVEVKIPFFLD